MFRDSIHIIGASGHAKVVIATLEAAGRSIEALYDDDSKKWGQTVLGRKIVGPTSAGPGGAQAIIAIGANRGRREDGRRPRAPGRGFGAAGAPAAGGQPAGAVG